MNDILIGNNVTSTITSNIFNSSNSNSVVVDSNLVNTIQQNTFTNLQQRAIIFNQNTTISQNSIDGVCITGGTCSALATNASIPS